MRSFLYGAEKDTNNKVTWRREVRDGKDKEHQGLLATPAAIEEAQYGFCLRDSRRNQPSDTLISVIWSAELWDTEILLF